MAKRQPNERNNNKMPMTQKEARFYVEPDSGNWIQIEKTDHLEVYRLTFKSLTFYRIDIWRMMLDDDQLPRIRYTRQADRGVIYYIGEHDNQFGSPCSMTFIHKAIYNEGFR